MISILIAAQKFQDKYVWIKKVLMTLCEADIDILKVTFVVNDKTCVGISTSNFFTLLTSIIKKKKNKQSRLFKVLDGVKR